MKRCVRVGCSELAPDPYEVYCPRCQREIEAKHARIAAEQAAYEITYRQIHKTEESLREGEMSVHHRPFTASPM